MFSEMQWRRDNQEGGRAHNESQAEVSLIPPLFFPLTAIVIAIAFYQQRTASVCR